MTKRGVTSLGVALLMGAACSVPTDDCAAVWLDGIRLAVVDSVNGADLSALASVTVTQLSAPFATATGSLKVPPSPLDIAANRSGSYRVGVAVQGYKPWTANVGVRDRGGDCAFVITTFVVARLVPDR